MVLESEDQASEQMSLAGIVTVARNGAIGINNRLPVRLLSDRRRFRILTNNKPIIMGRKTHESIGRCLPSRTNIVLSHNPDYKGADGSITVNSLTDAYETAVRTKAKRAFVIGGGQIFSFFLPILDKIYLTVIDADLEGDTFFPIPVEVMLRWGGKRVQSTPKNSVGKYKQSLYIITIPDIDEVANYLELPFLQGV